MKRCWLIFLLVISCVMSFGVLPFALWTQPFRWEMLAGITFWVGAGASAFSRLRESGVQILSHQGMPLSHYFIVTSPLVAGLFATAYLMDGALNLKALALWMVLSGAIAGAIGLGWNSLFGSTAASITVTSIEQPLFTGTRTRYTIETDPGSPGKPTRFDDPIRNTFFLGLLLFCSGALFGLFILFFHCPGAGWGC